MNETNGQALTQTPGGSGALRELASDGVDGIRTTRMLERAVKQGWPIPEELKAAIVQRQVEIATDSGSSNREATSAARCLVSMEAQNIETQAQAQNLAVIQNNVPRVIFHLPDNGRNPEPD